MEGEVQMEGLVTKVYKESIAVKEAFFKEETHRIIEVASLIAETFTRGNKLLLIGNGGSAADAQHIAAEFVNRFRIERPPLPALALTTDTSIITSIGNDYEFRQIFAKQVKALGKEGDILMAISTSGSSPNILEAIKAARKMDIKVIGLTGRDGGEMAGMVDIPLVVRSDNTPRIQEVHITVGHILCELVDYILFKKPLEEVE